MRGPWLGSGFMDAPEAMIHSISRQVIGKMAVLLMRRGKPAKNRPKSSLIDVEMDLHLTNISNITLAIDTYQYFTSL